MVRAPVHDPDFLVWVRSQVLRLAPALFRRYEQRLSVWPCRLFALIDPLANTEKKQAVASELLAARPQMLDCYSLGIRNAFTTAEQLRSPACLTTLAGDFRNHDHNIAQIERLSAELTRGHNRRAPARSFPNTAAASVLRQANVVHRTRGGENPLAPRALMKQQREKQLVCSLLLLPLLGGITEASAATDVASAALADGGLAELAVTNVVPSAAQVHVHEVVAAPSSAFGGPVAIIRGNPLLLGQPHAGDEPHADVRKRGLNPYMLEKNKYMATTRTALGRPMTLAEQWQAAADLNSGPAWTKMSSRRRMQSGAMRRCQAKRLRTSSPTRPRGGGVPPLL